MIDIWLIFDWFWLIYRGHIFYNPAVWLLLPGWLFSHTAAGGFYLKLKKIYKNEDEDEMRWDDDEDEDEDEDDLQLLNDDLQLFASSLQLI